MGRREVAGRGGRRAKRGQRGTRRWTGLRCSGWGQLASLESCWCVLRAGASQVVKAGAKTGRRARLIAGVAIVEVGNLVAGRGKPGRLEKAGSSGNQGAERGKPQQTAALLATQESWTQLMVAEVECPPL